MQRGRSTPAHPASPSVRILPPHAQRGDPRPSYAMSSDLCPLTLLCYVLCEPSWEEVRAHRLPVVAQEAAHLLHNLRACTWRVSATTRQAPHSYNAVQAKCFCSPCGRGSRELLQAVGLARTIRSHAAATTWRPAALDRPPAVAAPLLRRSSNRVTPCLLQC